MFSLATTIAFEGADQVGKATQAALLAEHLREEGFSVKQIEAPIRSALTYRVIYWMLKNGLAAKMPNLFQFVQFLNKLWYQLFAFHWDRRKHDYIIFDRWSLSSLVYGKATGTSEALNWILYRALRRPDTNVVIIGRKFSEKPRDSYETDLQLQERVAQEYRVWSYDPRNIRVATGDLSKESIHKFIWSAISKKGLL